MLDVQTITDRESKQILLDVLADHTSRSILNAIIDIPKSIREISDETRVPLRTVYKKSQQFHDSKLLKVSGFVTESGKKYFLYKSLIRSIVTSYNNNVLTVEVTKN